jgi:hypothetical protein
MQATSLSRATVFRVLRDLREQLAAEVSFQGQDSRYHVLDWGLLDRSKAIGTSRSLKA